VERDFFDDLIDNIEEDGGITNQSNIKENQPQNKKENYEEDFLDDLLENINEEEFMTDQINIEEEGIIEKVEKESSFYIDDNYIEDLFFNDKENESSSEESDGENVKDDKREDITDDLINDLITSNINQEGGDEEQNIPQNKKDKNLNNESSEEKEITFDNYLDDLIEDELPSERKKTKIDDGIDDETNYEIDHESDELKKKILNSVDWENLDVRKLTDKEAELIASAFPKIWWRHGSPRYIIEQHRRYQERGRVTKFVKNRIDNIDEYVENGKPIIIDGEEYFIDRFGHAHQVKLDSQKKEIKEDLYKEGMEEVIVTPDGKSLADMLPHLRSGGRKFKQEISDITDIGVTESRKENMHGGKRYSNHARALNNKIQKDKERIKKEKHFVQRNAKHTEAEKIIMRNLGIKNQDFLNLMRSSEIDRKEKEKVLTAGRVGDERIFKGRRYRTTVGDIDVLIFLAKFKMASSRTLRWLKDEPISRTYRRMHRLKDNGLIVNLQILGLPDMWTLTEAGMAFAGYDFKTLRESRQPKYSTLPPIIGVNYLAACLWNNKINVLNLKDFPAENKIIATNEIKRVTGEMLISELEIRSNLGKEINHKVSTLYKGDKSGGLYEHVYKIVDEMFREWEDNGREGESPEMELGNELCWVLYPKEHFIRSHHVPDLVVKRDRGNNGEPKSIAVELELTMKSKIDSYRKTMLAYKLDNRIYEKVIWVTSNARIARQLKKAADEVGFKRYDIVPIITKDGIYKGKDIWMI